MAGVESAGDVWPATVVHVNEDGWVLLNRGGRHGVAPGLRLLVVGDAVRELRDTAADGAPPTLRIRRTYELLDVVYTEEQCAVAIAARVPRERRPQIYRAPNGELLVWVPLPPDYTWPNPAAGGVAAGDDTGDETDEVPDLDNDTAGEDETGEEEATDAESLAEQQEDDRWEQALPLNGLHVGDLVLPAILASGTAGADPSSERAPVEQQDTPFDAGRDYDWLNKPPS